MGKPPRVRPLDVGEAPEVADLLETYRKERGNVPNMFRTVAHRPRHLRTMLGHFCAY
ncbi:MAG: hypothetical protein HY702_00815 [Gemmatimonadetes bacterium]|nr:hypothetical protein [Gemmatimonadota bacterium]